MLVFGDPSRRYVTRELIRSAFDHLDELDGATRDSLSDATVKILVDVGCLTQAILDAQFERRGCDAFGALERSCHVAVWHAARLVLEQGDGGALRRCLEALSSLELPQDVSVKLPEGFAFYAVHPLLYAGAARKWRAELDGPFVAIGLRSIGTSLAAMVAAAGQAAHPPITLRSVGPPFRRELRLSDSLTRWLTSLPEETHFAIVDDGPRAIRKQFWRRRRLVRGTGSAPGPARILPFPSQRPGAGGERHASETLEEIETIFQSFESLLESRSPWADSRSGIVESLSAGAWRERFWPERSSWPPSNVWMERRKFLGTGHDGAGAEVQWLAKFVGYGRIGERLASRDRLIADAGFSPRVLRLNDGFLFTEWLDEARPLWSEPVADREKLLEHLARWIAFRARGLPLEPGERGASPSQLLEMARRNAGIALGEEADVLEHWENRLNHFAAVVKPVCTDNRMQPWEWLQLPDGRLLKADAVDHHASHEMVGPQDPWWDAAGAIVEFGFAAREEEHFVRRLIAWNVLAASRELRDFFVQMYLAYQLGFWTLAAESQAGDEGSV